MHRKLAGMQQNFANRKYNRGCPPSTPEVQRLLEEGTSPALQTDEGRGGREPPNGNDVLLRMPEQTQSVTQVCGNTTVQQAMENSGHRTLQGGRGLARAKGHPRVLKMAMLTNKGSSPLLTLTNTIRSINPSQFGKPEHPCTMAGRRTSNETLTLTALSVNLQSHHPWLWQRTCTTEGRGAQWSSCTPDQGLGAR